MKPDPSAQTAADAPARDSDELLPEYDPALIRSGERGRYLAAPRPHSVAHPPSRSGGLP